MTYGPGQSLKFLVARLAADLSNGVPVVISRPEDRRDLIHVSDVIDALIALSRDPVRVVNISTGAAPTMREVAQLVAKLMDADPRLVQFGQTREAPVVLLADPSRANAQLGWAAKYDLRQGIQQLLARPDRTRLVS